jgi:hypothetical protein
MTKHAYTDAKYVVGALSRGVACLLSESAHPREVDDLPARRAPSLSNSAEDFQRLVDDHIKEVIEETSTFR